MAAPSVLGGETGIASFEAAGTQPIVAPSSGGAHRIALALVDPAARRGSIHAWRVRIESLTGEPIRPTRIAFSGGMPQHGHGFQTAPRVTRALADSWYRIDGVQFHMPGVWTLRIEFATEAGPDLANVELDVPY